MTWNEALRPAAAADSDAKALYGSIYCGPLSRRDAVLPSVDWVHD